MAFGVAHDAERVDEIYDLDEVGLGAEPVERVFVAARHQFDERFHQMPASCRELFVCKVARVAALGTSAVSVCEFHEYLFFS